MNETVYLCFNCEKKENSKKKEKKKNGWSKKTTRNCFFNEHFNIENDSGTLQNSATNNWKQQTERRKCNFWSKKQLRNTTGRTTRISCWEICRKLWLMVWNTTILHFTKKLHCNIMGKHFALLLQFLIKKLKKEHKMQFSVLGNNNYTINEQEHNTDRIFHHWKHQKKCLDYLFYSMLPKIFWKGQWKFIWIRKSWARYRTKESNTSAEGSGCK